MRSEWRKSAWETVRSRPAVAGCRNYVDCNKAGEAPWRACFGSWLTAFISVLESTTAVVSVRHSVAVFPYEGKAAIVQHICTSGTVHGRYRMLILLADRAYSSSLFLKLTLFTLSAHFTLAAARTPCSHHHRRHCQCMRRPLMFPSTPPPHLHPRRAPASAPAQYRYPQAPWTRSDWSNLPSSAYGQIPWLM